MLARNPSRMTLTVLVLGAVCLVPACTSVLGFDDVEFEQDGGSDGASGSGGSLGDAGGMGGGSGEGGVSGTGGTGTGGTGTGGTASGGTGGTGNTGGTAGVAGSGGTGGSAGTSGSGGATGGTGGTGATGGTGGTGTGATGGTGGTSATGGTGGTGTGGTGGGTSGAGGGAGCTASPGTPVACSTTLASRITTTNVPGTGGSTIFLSAQPSGCSKAAWVGSGSVHVTPLDGADQRFADDATTTGSEIRGLVAHDDASAVLVRRDDQMVLVRLAANGVPVFENIIVGDNTHQVDGDRWIDSWPHEGRLAWSGDTYAAYFGQTGNWGSQGNHQGDHLSMFSATGAVTSGGWDWGCSHSLDVRITHNGTRFGPVCLSDCYPGKGIYFNHNTLVNNEPSGNCSGGSSAALGGLASANDGFWLTFVSEEGRASHDVALSHIPNSGAPAAPIWLTDTASVEETQARLAPYGGNMLVGWRAGTQTKLAVLDMTGAIVQGPEDVSVTLPSGSDLTTFPNGDVGWAISGSGGFDVVRVARCQ